MKRGLALIAVLLVAGCAGRAGGDTAVPAPAPTVSPAHLVPDGYTGRFQVTAAVLENAQHGPQLCTTMADSYPPQCGGPDVAGWHWDGVKYESAVKSKWGSYVLVGTFDGKTFTLTQPPRTPDEPTSTPDGQVKSTTPCPAPAGGWKPVDAARATDATFNDVVAKANADKDFGGLWIDEPAAALDLTPHNDPRRMVLNVRYTKDLARHEADLRKIWGGALCVSPARHTEAELRRIQDELTKEPGVVTSGTEPISGVVTVGVYVAKESLQQDFDTRFGSGVVVLEGLLTPLD